MRIVETDRCRKTGNEAESMRVLDSNITRLTSCSEPSPLPRASSDRARPWVLYRCSSSRITSRYHFGDVIVYCPLLVRQQL